MSNNIKYSEILSLDISNFSTLSSIEQINTIRILNKILLTNDIIKTTIPILIPNGDGFHIIFNSKYQAYKVALYLKSKEHLIMKIIPKFKGVRISVHEGSYFHYINILGNSEYMGKGIQETEKLTTMKKMFFQDSVLVNINCIDFEIKNEDFKYSNDIHEIILDNDNPKTYKIINIWNK